ncbi:MAG: DUF1684 domain-containing protein [Acidobacteria bacterium]|nr:DUF1684 domain-containing protein [Acidobacteriota bacterium]
MNGHDSRAEYLSSGTGPAAFLFMILLMAVFIPSIPPASAIRESAATTGSQGDPAADAYIKEIQQWHAKREALLGSENGWLTLVGLAWLAPGENSFGSDPSGDVILPADKAPARAGILILDDDGVTVVPEAPGLLLDGEPVTSRHRLTDADGTSHILTLGSLRLYIIRRGGKFGVRIKDPSSALRRDFTGVATFPIDTGWRVEGRWEAYPEPRQRQIPTVTGTPAKMLAPGRVHLTLGGREMTLEPVIASPEDRTLFFIFKDGTTGHDTYGGGRYLYSPLPRDGRLILDFNKAHNPPCAFTPYATCPLPPPGNTLPIRVEAGEKDFNSH